MSTAGTPTSHDEDLAALRDEVRALRLEVERQRQVSPLPTSTPPRAVRREKPLGYEELWPWILPSEGVSVPGYVQAQYETHQDSQDQLSATGTLLNKDRFSIRRARIGVTGEWEYAAVALQLDANTTKGPQVDLRKAEASLQYRPDRAVPPLVMATIGLFDIPFGFENVEASHTRWFMEPSTASQAFFPGQADLGVRLAGAYRFLRWTLAVQNGEPLGVASPYVAEDPLEAKELVARIGFDTPVRSNLQMAGGVSALTGSGFHAGTSASTPSGDMTGQAATPSESFNHWAVGADYRTSIRWWLGVVRFSTEVVLAQNLDRQLYVADPVLNGGNATELGFNVAATQRVTRWAVVGLRFDRYDPDSNLFGKRRVAPTGYSEAVETVSPLIGLVLPDRARLLVQYDIIHNAYGKSSTGVPTSLADDVLTIRLQMQL